MRPDPGTHRFANPVKLVGYQDKLSGVPPTDAWSKLSSRPDSAISQISRFTKRDEQIAWAVSVIESANILKECWFTATGLQYLPWLRLELLQGPVSFAEFWRVFVSRNMMVTASETSLYLEIEEGEQNFLAWIHPNLQGGS